MPDEAQHRYLFVAIDRATRKPTAWWSVLTDGLVSLCNNPPCASAAELEKTLSAYLRVYNHHIPQKALNHQTPMQALKVWQQNKPDIFVKKVYDQVGLDI